LIAGTSYEQHKACLSILLMLSPIPIVNAYALRPAPIDVARRGIVGP